MTRKKSAAHPLVMTSIAAHLFVSSISQSRAFFVDKLGFEIDFMYGEPPFYAQVSRDRALVALRLVPEPVFAGDIRARESLVSASITVATAREIEALFLQYQDAKVSFNQSLRDEPWGAKTFVIEDPDGNLILFAGPAE